MPPYSDFRNQNSELEQHVRLNSLDDKYSLKSPKPTQSQLRTIIRSSIKDKRLSVPVSAVNRPKRRHSTLIPCLSTINQVNVASGQRLTDTNSTSFSKVFS